MRFSQLAPVLGMSVILVGCGKAEYEQQMQKSKEQLGFASKFLVGLHREPVDINGVATIQLPITIDIDANQFDRNSRDRRTNEPIARERLHPPFVNIPGHLFCREYFRTISGSDHPVYCYVGVVPADQQNAKAIMDSVRRGVGGSFRGANWQAASLDRPDRSKIECMKIVAKGEQIFETSINGGSLDKLPGQFELYLHSTPAFHILIGFRSTDAFAQEEQFFAKTPLSLGTLQVTGGAPGGGGEVTDS